MHHGGREALAVLVDHLALVALDGVKNALDERLRVLYIGYIYIYMGVYV